MKKPILSLIFTLLCLASASAENLDIYDLVPGMEYYIYNNFYNRPLGINKEGNGPYLIEYDHARQADYIWVVEDAGNSDYVLLKQKSSGKYMTASTSNSYSTLLSATKSTADNYQWRVRPGMNGSLVSRKSTDKALGVDKNETKENIGVWYDKTFGTETSSFAIVPNDGKGLESSLRNWLATDLMNIIELAQSEAQNLKNPMNYRAKFKYSIESAQNMIKDESTALDALKEKSVSLRDSLATMLSYNDAQVLLTEQEMSGFGSTFSLASTGLKLNQEQYPADSTYFIIRGRDGRGARIVIKEEGDYVFVKEGREMRVYLNQELLQTLPAVYLPQLTSQETEAEWTVVRKSRLNACQSEVLSETKVVTEVGQEETNKYGNKTRTLISLSNTTMTLDHQVDLHLTSEEQPLANCTINLAYEKAWLIFDNTRPSKVNSDFLKYIQINGKKAVLNENCRIVIYLNGAMVMPYVAKSIFTGYEGEQYTGAKMEYGLGQIADLNKNSNRIRSFRLKRGYMVTLASSKNGKGYSRVYVADHQDIEVPVLPNALYGRISSIYVKKWQYVSKKGWGSTNAQGAINSQVDKLRTTWYYSWSADRSSTLDAEYIPIRQHKWWPSINDIAKHTDATACLSLNEPEHSEQHNNCDCGGAINEWTACTLTPDFQVTGMRIGSPAPTDAGWLSNYIGHCNDMAYRCDFVAIHAYWGPNEAANPDAWYNKLKAIYDATKRPIWITEWAYGASWTTEGWPSDWSEKLEKNRAAVKGILQKLEEAPFVERYAYYQWDTQFRNLVDWSDGHVTPAGKVYRDTKSNFAYNADVQFTPVWWAPGVKTPIVKAQVNEADETLSLIITNENTDVTDKLIIQVSRNAGEWEDYYTETERYLFEDNTLSYSFPLSDFNLETDKIRVYVKRTLGEEIYSKTASFGYITNPEITTSSKSAVEGWTLSRSAANGYTKHDSGDTYLEVWDPSVTGMQFDYYQDISDLPEGIYELSGAVFNSSNDVAGAEVNGSVVLYAQADSVMYFQQVKKDANLDNLTDADRLTIPGIVVRNGQLRLGIRNIGDMTARWAGGDSFRLIRTGSFSTNGMMEYVDALHAQNKALADAFMTYTNEEQSEADASSFIVNAKCDRKDTYGWKVTNSGTASDKAADGVSGNAYWNLWKSTPYTATMEQDITYLPEGEYSLKALVRGSASEELTLTATVMRDGEEKKSDETTSATFSIKGSGEGDIMGSGYKNGWSLQRTPYVVIRPGDTLHISFKASVTSGSGWWSVDNFGLDWRQIESRTTDIEQTPAAQDGKTQGYLFDLTGRKISLPLQHGLYIRDGRKILK